jgi:urocanate hydratase
VNERGKKKLQSMATSYDPNDLVKAELKIKSLIEENAKLIANLEKQRQEMQKEIDESTKTENLWMQNAEEHRKDGLELQKRNQRLEGELRIYKSHHNKHRDTVARSDYLSIENQLSDSVKRETDTARQNASYMQKITLLEARIAEQGQALMRLQQRGGAEVGNVESETTCFRNMSSFERKMMKKKLVMACWQEWEFMTGSPSEESSKEFYLLCKSKVQEMIYKRVTLPKVA